MVLRFTKFSAKGLASKGLRCFRQALGGNYFYLFFFRLKRIFVRNIFSEGEVRLHNIFVVLSCNFRSLAFLGLLGFLIRHLKI